MHSPRLLDHFENPRNTGELPLPAQTVEVSNPVCGDILRLSVLWDGDRVKAVGYRARGCTACVAAGSALTEMMEDQTRAQVRAINREAIDESLGGLIPESKHVAVLCLDAIRALIR
ncbi:MAG: iron-sulfur cluster assembly scaffold protein [Bryobacteraceae bacterium]|nr:iron-sulfur cluster assembly scaffold protein [Bryobacteraceae bacterium]